LRRVDHRLPKRGFSLNFTAHRAVLLGGHVVLPEIAHHFGISDERLIELDRY